MIRPRPSAVKVGGVRRPAVPTPARPRAGGLSRTPGRARPSRHRSAGEAITGNALGQAWRKAARNVGLGHFHVHDVRHAGLTMAAQFGATTRELMDRAGHSTPRAALIYQHVAQEREVAIAAGLDALAGLALEPRKDD